MSKWNTGKPKETGYYIVASLAPENSLENTRYTGVCWYESDIDYWYLGNGIPVTHWIKLPEMPLPVYLSGRSDVCFMQSSQKCCESKPERYYEDIEITIRFTNKMFQEHSVWYASIDGNQDFEVSASTISEALENICMSIDFHIRNAT